MPHADAQRVVAIAGMHRSGTSCLAGSLEAAGLYLGHVNREAKHNRKGNRESRAIMQWHDRLLAENGGSWCEVPDRICCSDELTRELDCVISTYPEDRIWGFKDPRVTLLLDYWRGRVQNLMIVASFRHPSAVAASLAARDRFTVEQSLRLWLTYNTKLIEQWHAAAFPLINFDDDKGPYLESLRSIAAALGLKGDPVFYEQELKRNTANAALDLPADVISAYQCLLRLSKQKVTPRHW